MTTELLKNCWKPTASFANLKLRADILAKIRCFFAERSVMEVETPLLEPYTVTDPHIASFSVSTADGIRYLQTSPEYAMKRLLAAGAGCIYQMCKAFRADEKGRWHNPEFTMLEWYRIGFDHHRLMDEVDALLKIILNTPSAQRVSYAQLFQNYFQLDIHHCSDDRLREKITQAQWLHSSVETLSRDTCCELLMSHAIEPQLGFDAPVFVYDFPPTQAALARLSQTQPSVAQRFELYIQGMELANGFYELSDPVEQEQRFLRDQKNRVSAPEIDPRLLSALHHGLPDCAGVALGVDRLIMIAASAPCVDEVVSFIE